MIRRLNLSDISFILEIIYQSKIWNCFGYEEKPSYNKLEKKMIDLFKMNGWWVYYLKGTNKIIGWSFLGKTWMNTQISYYIDNKFRNKGYTLEATNAILNNFIKYNKDKKIKYIVGYVKEDNIISKKILNSLGFKYSSSFEYDLYYYYL